jgi:hypothetical protein
MARRLDNTVSQKGSKAVPRAMASSLYKEQVLMHTVVLKLAS